MKLLIVVHLVINNYPANFHLLINYVRSGFDSISIPTKKRHLLDAFSAIKLKPETIRPVGLFKTLSGERVKPH